MNINFIPITNNESEMEPYLVHPFCIEVFNAFNDYYPKIGFHFPWVGYFALINKEVIGVGGFKGAPKNDKVEIAYGTLPGKEGNGYATTICKELVNIALKEDSGLNITARTLMEENASTTLLKKNGFIFSGIVNDPEDGDVWEWHYKNN
jgi:RimJ/RimL family protein N-acetyltransferase